MKNKIAWIVVVLVLCVSFSLFAQDEDAGPYPDRATLQEQQDLPEEQDASMMNARQQAPNYSPSPVSVSQAQQGKITLDIKGMDIVDVLKMLATRANMNIVIGKNVTGRVTLFLKDVEVWDAFEIILLANDLAYEKKGNILNVMTQRDYELLYGQRYQDKKQARVIRLKYAKAADLSRALNQIKTNVGRIVVDEGSNTLALIDMPDKIKEMEEFIKNTDLPLKTQVFDLNYAQAEKLNTKLQEAITKGVGSLRIDERTNKIAITDYPEKLSEIEKIIKAFDEKTPQVLIDAQIIELSPSDKFTMGVDWDYWIKKHFKVVAPLPIKSVTSAVDNAALFLSTATSGSTGPGEYKGIIDILRTIGDTKILSSPRILVLNNQEAKIHVGKKEAYITSTTSQSGTGPNVTSQSVNFVDVGIKLNVTPTINDNNFITMKIRPEISDAETVSITSEGQKTDIPIVTTSEAETTVMLKDGVTLIIGGLKKEERTKTVKKIPFIGDIPGVGFLFRSTSDETKTSELVILLTPHIMSGEETYSDFSEIKPKDGTVVRLEKGKIVTEKVSAAMKEKSAEETKDKYYKEITDKVKALALFSRTQKEKGRVDLSFTLSSDGKLKGEPRVVSSTNQNLNAVAVESLKNLSFSAFPKELNKAEESFHVMLEYN